MSNHPSGPEKSSDLPPDLAVDLGTSPHGLAAELPLPHQETPDASSCRLPAKPLLTLPGVYRSEKVRSACRTIKAAAAEHHYPLVLSASQMKHIERAISLALNEAIEALDCEPSDCHHEIQPDVDAFNQIHALLKQARTYRKGGKNELWQEDAL